MTFAIRAHRSMDTVTADGPVILMIDPERRLLDCTPMGQRILKEHDPLICEFGRIRACAQLDQARLDRFIPIAIETGSAELTLAGRPVEIIRLGSPAGEGCLLLIFLQREDESRHVEQVASRFGLTVAERRLLALLFEGMSLAGAALSLGVARTTVRTHLQRIFDKTGRRRQSDLVRLVALGTARKNNEAREHIPETPRYPIAQSTT